jgi:single-stranded-DNA-specific exonuclease
MDRIWQLATSDVQEADALQKALKIPTPIIHILTQRGIKTYEQANVFFRPQLSQLHDPFLMKDMQAAVDCLVEAISTNKKIMIYGDYDVDGTTSVGVMYQFLQHFTSNLLFYIPNRFAEGYGVSQIGIDYAFAQKVDVLITLDCGIKSVEILSKAQANGMQVIVCDHHQPDEKVPSITAILNPKQKDCDYPFKELCGCGVGYKLMCAVEKTIADEQHFCNEFLDLVATAIAADIVPIIDENRILAYYGLLKANTKPCAAIQALQQIADVQKAFTISDLVFIVAPRVNAAGRMEDGSLAVELFISTQVEQAKLLAQKMHINNEDRRETDKEMTAEASILLQQLPANQKATILYQAHWHSGVVGIVASRMIEQKYQPTIILTESNGFLKGSARSIPGLNLFEALHQCADLLENFGGHYFAAGLTLAPKNLAAFTEQFNSIVSNTLQANDFIPKVHIDSELTLDYLQEKFYNIIEQMEPFGPHNLRPVFIAKNVNNHRGQCAVVKEKHLRLVIEQNGIVAKGIAFGMAHLYPIVAEGIPFDICFTIEKNTWNNATNIEMKVVDIHAASQA